MRINIFFFLIILSLFACKAKQKVIQNSCPDFKTGTFKLEGRKHTYIIERKGDLQIEREIDTDGISEWKINWISNCEYTLLMIKDNQGFLEKNVAPFFNTKIINSTPNYYVFNIYNKEKFILSDTIFRVN